MASPYLNNWPTDEQLVNGFYRTTSDTHRVIGGHDIIITIGGYAIGRAQAITSTIDFGIEPVFEIGSMKPREFVPMRYNGQLTLERYLIREGDLIWVLKNRAKGLATENSKGQSNTSNLKYDFSLSDEGKILLNSIAGIQIIVKDKYSKTNVESSGLRAYNNCVFASYDCDFRAGALAGERATVYYTEVVTPADKSSLSATAVGGAGAGAGS